MDYTPPHPDAQLSWEDLAPRFDALQTQALTTETVPDWLEAWSDLAKDVGEAHAWLMRAKDENTADEGAEAAYGAFVREVLPNSETASQRLSERLLGLKGYTPAPEHTEFVRRLRNQADLFNETNAHLLSEIQALSNEFNKLKGALIVKLDGETLTLPQAEKRLLEPDRGVRERAWRAIQAAEAEVAPALDKLFLKLLSLRRQVAKNAGLPDFRAYQWRALDRFDYTPEDALTFHETIAETVVPLLKEQLERRRRALGVEALRPWDFQVDPGGRTPLKPFETVGELEEGLTRIFSRLDPALGRQFDAMRGGWLDLEPRAGKVPGFGYSLPFPKSERAYIYHSAVGTHADVWVMLHEAGHSFHALAASAAHDLVWNRETGAEFAEVASQAMELLALPYLEEEQGGFYTREEAARARDEQLERVLRLLCGTAHADAFQHWLYADAPEDVTVEAMDAKWVELSERFSPGVDWAGLERAHQKGWQMIHLFFVPFYMLEYALAYLGALQVWRNSLTNKEEALKKYREALVLGGSRSLPELFEAAGATFALDRETVGELAAFVAAELNG